MDNLASWIPIALGTIGTVTGIWSLLIHSRNYRFKASVQMRPRNCDTIVNLGDGDMVFPRERSLSVTVVNFSHFDIWVDEIGLVLGGSFGRKTLLAVVEREKHDDQRSDGYKIKTRSSKEFFVNITYNVIRRGEEPIAPLFVAANDKTIHDSRRCYVRLATGHKFYGSRSEMRVCLKSLNELFDYYQKNPDESPNESRPRPEYVI